MDLLHGGQVGAQPVERLLTIEQLPLPERATTDRRTILQGHPSVLWPMAKQKEQPESTSELRSSQIIIS